MNRFHEFITALKVGGSKYSDDCAKMADRANKFALNPGGLTTDVREGAVSWVRQLIGNKLFPMPYDECLFQIGPDGMAENEAFKATIWVLAWKAPLENGEWAVYFRVAVEACGSGPFAFPYIGQIFCEQFDEDGSYGFFKLVSADWAQVDLNNAGVSRIKQGLISAEDMKRRVQASVPNMSQEDVDDVWNDLVQGGEEKLQRVAFDNMDRAFTWLLTALGLLSTSNGIAQSLVKAPRFTNAQRAKKGKPPIYEHKVLTVSIGAVALPGVTRAGGQHASPRMHWRRGHIRKLGTGKVIEVRPCIVGDPSRGTISKEYAIQPPGNRVLLRLPPCGQLTSAAIDIQPICSEAYVRNP